MNIEVVHISREGDFVPKKYLGAVHFNHYLSKSLTPHLMAVSNNGKTEADIAFFYVKGALYFWYLNGFLIDRLMSGGTVETMAGTMFYKHKKEAPRKKVRFKLDNLYG